MLIGIFLNPTLAFNSSYENKHFYLSFRNTLKKDSLSFQHDTVYVMMKNNSDTLFFTSVDTLNTDNISITDSIKYVNADSLKTDTLTKKKAKSSDAFSSDVIYSAQDSIMADMESKYLHLYNKASVSFDGITLTADYIRVDQNTMTVFAKGVKDSSGHYVGRPYFSGQGSEIIADSLAYNFKSKKAKLWSGVTTDSEGFVRGGEMKLNEDKEGFMRKGVYTTCNNPDHPHFGFNISKAKITEKTIVSGPANMQIEGVETPIALPFGFYPKTNNKKSGILIPAVGEDAAKGFFFRDLGYYMVINDYVDATVTTSKYTNGSYDLGLSSRYSKRYKFNGNFEFDYSYQRLGDEGTPSFSQSKDFQFKWQHSQFNQGTGSNFSASVDMGSSSFYENSGSVESLPDRMNNTTASSIAYSKNWKDTPFNFSTAFTSSQDLDNGNINMSFPSINFGMARIYPFDSEDRVGPQKWYHKINISYNMQLNSQIDTYDTVLTARQARKDIKSGISHSIPIQTSFNVFKYININPSFNIEENWYGKTTEQQWNASSNKVDTTTNKGFSRATEYNFSTSASTTLYGMTKFKDNSFVKAIRHTLRPSISYTYRPDFSQDKYGNYKSYTDGDGKTHEYSIYDNSLYGGPANGKSSSIGFSLGNNLEMKVKSKSDSINGEKKIAIFSDLSISSSYNFAAEEFKLAPISISGFTNIYEGINLNFGTTLNPYDIDDEGYMIDEFSINNGGPLVRMTNAYVSLSTSLNSEAKGKRTFTPQQLRELYLIDPNPNNFVDFTIPWNVTIDYSLNYNNSYNESEISQIINVSGDFSITENWKLNGMTGYDITNQCVTETSIGIVRDLHCWDLSIYWVPFGEYKSYTIDLKVKAPSLQDLKISKRRPYYISDEY